MGEIEINYHITTLFDFKATTCSKSKNMISHQIFHFPFYKYKKIMECSPDVLHICSADKLHVCMELPSTVLNNLKCF